MTAIIIDDETQSHKALKQIIQHNHPDIEILASGYCVREGLELIRTHHPDLVFLDIEMPDGLGFDLLRQLGKPNFHIIFITAHGHYAHSAIKFGAIDYLLKPISAIELGEAIQRTREKKVAEEQLQIMWEALQGLKEKRLPSRIGISTLEGIIYRSVRDIIRLEAEQNYTKFSLANEQKMILASVNIGEYESQFEPYREFMRVHRSHIINLTYVERFVKGEGGYLIMQDNSKISVSRRMREELLVRLEEL